MNFDERTSSGRSPASDDGAGPVSIFIDLAGTLVEVRSSSGRWREAVRDRYRPFLRRPGDPEIVITHDDDVDSMRARHGFLSTVAVDGRSAEVAERGGTEILDGVLRTLLPGVIVPDLMVHGALFSDEGKGFLCCGVSGSGKTTIAGLFPETALCDELVRIHVDSRGIEARSLPFWVARPGSVALQAVYILEHGRENRRTRLDPGETVRVLRRHVYWSVDGDEALAGAFGTLTELCRRVPAFRLAFRPDRSVWATMTGRC